MFILFIFYIISSISVSIRRNVSILYIMLSTSVSIRRYIFISSLLEKIQVRLITFTTTAIFKLSIFINSIFYDIKIWGVYMHYVLYTFYKILFKFVLAILCLLVFSGIGFVFFPYCFNIQLLCCISILLNGLLILLIGLFIYVECLPFFLSKGYIILYWLFFFLSLFFIIKGIILTTEALFELFRVLMDIAKLLNPWANIPQGGNGGNTGPGNPTPNTGPGGNFEPDNRNLTRKEKKKIYNDKYYKEKKEEIKEKSKNKKKDKEKIKKTNKKYWDKNKEKINEKRIEKRRVQYPENEKHYEEKKQ